MIVSVNADPNRSEFDLLLNSTIAELNIHAEKSSKKVSTLSGPNAYQFRPESWRVRELFRAFRVR